MSVSLRPLERADLPDLARWLAAAHVQSFWRDSDVTLDQVEAKYGPRIDGSSPLRVFVIEVEGRAVGMVQTCPASAYAWWPTELGLQDHVVLDGLLGDEAVVGEGHASEALRLLVETLLLPQGTYTGVCACTRADNARTRRLLERGGFMQVFVGDLERDGLPAHAVYARRAARPPAQ